MIRFLATFENGKLVYPIDPKFFKNINVINISGNLYAVGDYVSDNDNLPSGVEPYVVDDEPVSITISKARFLDLLGFSVIAQILQLAKTNAQIAAAEKMMDVREEVTVTSDKMAMYYALLKSANVLNDADIERIKRNEEPALVN